MKIAYQEIEEPADSSRDTTDGCTKLHGCYLAGIQEGYTNVAECVDNIIEIPYHLRQHQKNICCQIITHKKKTAAFEAPGVPEADSPVTQARQTHMPTALNIIRALLPNRSTVKEQIMPPRNMQP